MPREPDGPGHDKWCTKLTDTCKIDAIEIVSPILFCDDPNPWYHEVQNMFSTMEKLGEFHSNKSCGFHLHVSPVEGAWTMPHLRRICLAIIHFEEAFEVILPEHRRGSQWIQNNRFDNSWLARLQDNETVQLINVCQTVAEIVGVMSPDRYYQWNFQNMQEEDGINTIEWRRPPGVSTIEECLVWSELCIDFLRSACRNDIDICGYGKDVAGLETFVRDGMIPGTSEERFLVPIFSGKSGRLQLRKQEKDDFDTLGHKAKDDEERTLRLRELRTWLNQN